MASKTVDGIFVDDGTKVSLVDNHQNWSFLAAIQAASQY